MLEKRFEADEAGAHESRLGAELGRHDAKGLVRRRDRLPARSLQRRTEHEGSRCGAEPAAHDGQIGIEDIHERPDRRPERRPDLGERCDRSGVSGPRPLDEKVRVGLFAEQLSGQAITRVPRGEHLQVSASAARAGQAALLEDDVPELRPAPEQASVADDTAADAGAEREHHEVVRAPPRPPPPLGERGDARVVLDRDRKAVAVARAPSEIEIVEREVRRVQDPPGSALEIRRDAVADRHHRLVEELVDRGVERSQHVRLGLARAMHLVPRVHVPVPIHESGQDLRTAHVEPDHEGSRHGAGYHSARMAVGDKPYRLYRGGRKKGKVPLASTTRPPVQPAHAPAPSERRRRRWWLWIALAVGGLLLFAVLWGVLGYRSFSKGVQKANARLPRAAAAQLSKRDSSPLSDPTTTLVIGTDGGRASGRQGAHRSDSLLLVRTDPGTHRVSYLSIPRDLRVEIPGYGTSKINAASQIGGPALTIATVKALTGLPIDHVVVVDFDHFRELIDAMGGVDVRVPKPILSNRFDCPYRPSRCASWKGWRFGKGMQHMDGRRALIYSRIRTNQLDPSDTDISRGNRQQVIADAVGGKIASFGTFVRLPFIGDSLAAPLTTDLSTWELAQLGWVRFRSGSSGSLHCRLGGDPATIGGESTIVGSEDNLAVVSMFVGSSAPVRPPKGSLYGAGCVRR